MNTRTHKRVDITSESTGARDYISKLWQAPDQARRVCGLHAAVDYRPWASRPFKVGR